MTSAGPTAAAAATGGGALVAVETLEAAQARLNAFTRLVPAPAARGGPGPLSGFAVAVKDAFDVARLPTTGGCGAFHDRIASTDSAVVAALRAAGAAVVAKTNQDELGTAATGTRSVFGPVANPWGEKRIPGGSSSGSAAAVAAGVVGVAIGGDTGGSIRIPASFCGVTGLKPTWGRVSLRGSLPMHPALDTAGPIARTVADCATVFRVLAGGAEGPAPPVAGLRIGLPRAFFSVVHPETAAAVEAAARDLEHLGAEVEELDAATGPELDEGWVGFRGTWAEMARSYPDLAGDHRVGHDVRRLLARGRDMSPAEEARSRARASQIRAGFERAFTQVDVLLTPTTPYPAPRNDVNEVEVVGGRLDVHGGGPSRLTVPVNLAGLPALTLPVGFTADGMPIGAQLIGRAAAEETLFSVGTTYQRATGHHLRRPEAGDG